MVKIENCYIYSTTIKNQETKNISMKLEIKTLK